MLGLTANEADTRSSVCPSGGALATVSAPTIPFAPVRFSTMNGCPVCVASWWPTTRAMVAGVPAPNGTITRTGRTGKAWPQEALQMQSAQSASANESCRCGIDQFLRQIILHSRPVHDLSAHHRHDRFDVLDLLCGHDEIVAVEHDQVRVFARLDRTEIAFLEDEARVAARVRDQRLRARDRLAIDLSPSDHAPGHREPEGVERVGSRHGGRVRPESPDRSEERRVGKECRSRW